MIQAGADGILTMFAAWNNRPNLFEISIADDRFDLIQSICASDHNDLAHGTRALECENGMRDDRPAGDRRKQFVETHAATVTGGDENSGKHKQKLKKLRGLKQPEGIPL
jgi:hypothetical protein